jgi:uridine kinase
MGKNNSHLIIGIAGGSGSGKTTISFELLKRVGKDDIAYIPHDAYYRENKSMPLEERKKINYDHPDSLETELLIEHLKLLASGQAVDIPVYDFSAHSRTEETLRVESKPIILIEGILIFVHSELRKLLDDKIFVDTDPDIRLTRRVRRDIYERGRSIDSILNQYEETVRPMHIKFVEPSKRYADVIIPEGGHNEVAIQMVTARLKKKLTEIKEEK